MDRKTKFRLLACIPALSLWSAAGCTSVPMNVTPPAAQARKAAARPVTSVDRRSLKLPPTRDAKGTRNLAAHPPLPSSYASANRARAEKPAEVAEQPSEQNVLQVSGIHDDDSSTSRVRTAIAEELTESPESAATNRKSRGARRPPVTVAHAEALPIKAPTGTTGRSLTQRLKIPPELPGANAPPISLPPPDPANPDARSRAIDKLFPQLPPVPPSADARPSPEATPWDLSQLEQFAMANNPVLVQAGADIDAAAGLAWQAGMYPNPTIGYEADTVNSNGTLNYQGVFINQTIKTAGKLELAKMSADVDTLNSQLALRKTRIDVLTKVRAGYYTVLVAQESVRASQALVRLTNEAFRLQVEQLQGGMNAPYEPMQLRALAVQSQGALRQAQNKYTSAWRTLASSLGTPDLAPQPLSGHADAPFPEIQYEASLAHLVENHTDVLTARNKVSQACINVRKEEVVPIPDIGVYTAVQRDFTTPPVLRYTYNLQVGVPVPIFDQNRGNIMNAQSQLIRAKKEEDRVRNDLTAQLADAYERYQSNRVLADYYRNQILPDQARVYRGVYQRYQEDSEQAGFGFGDIVVAQQNLLASITAYLSSLNSAWTAVTDIQGLLQMDSGQSVAPASGTEVPSPMGLREPQPAAPAQEVGQRTSHPRQPSRIRQASYSGFKGRNVFADKTD